MVCMEFEPLPQDGRRKRNHGAMAATKLTSCFTCLDSAAFPILN